jgi:hypothetical protein
MTFLELIKRDLDDYRMRARDGKVVVNRRALEELVSHFERVDSELRSRYSADKESFMRHLRDAITAAWHRSDKNGERTMMVIMDTLHPLLIEKEKLSNRLLKAHRYDF